jgi:flagellar basal-body rod modification protein FlgD
MAITSTADNFLALNKASATTGTSSSGSGSSSSAGASTATATSERFLKLLVTQMQNQDPLNPTDNAQITSQMAQINTVEGIQQLNTTMTGLNGQFAQLQALQGASLVGHDVTVQGNKITPSGGTASAGFELGTSADKVKVQVLNGAGAVVDTVDLSAQTAGRHSFDWASGSAADGVAYTFKVTATSSGNPVTATPLMRDRVLSVSAGAGGLVLQTRNSGDVAYSDVKSFD